MSTVLWVIQFALAATFAGSGLVKLTRSKAELAPTMGWVDDVPAGGVQAIGVLEVLAAVALVVPPLLGVATVLVPLAALGLVLLMIGAIVLHYRRSELSPGVVAATLLVLAAVVVWGRFGPYPG